jgi:hypothetical protein
MTKYFNGAISNDWATLGNWWNNNACTTPAGSLPGSGDDVVLKQLVGANTGGAIMVANMTLIANQGAIETDLTVTGVVTMQEGCYIDNCMVTAASFVFSGQDSYTGTNAYLIGNCEFSGINSYNSSDIDGNVTLSGYNSANVYGDIAGNMVLSGAYATVNYANVSGTVTMSGLYTVYQDGVIGGAVDVISATASLKLDMSFATSVTFHNPAALIRSMTDTAFLTPDFRLPFADVLGTGLL